MSSNQRPAVPPVDHNLLGAIIGLSKNAQKDGGLVKIAAWLGLGYGIWTLLQKED